MSEKSEASTKFYFLLNIIKNPSDLQLSRDTEKYSPGGYFYLEALKIDWRDSW